MLVQSIFADNTKLSIDELANDYTFEGYEVGNAYSFSLSKEAYDEIEVRIHDDNKKKAQAAVKIDGVWQMADTERDGSYDVFTMKKPGEFVLLYKEGNKAVPIAAGAGAAFVILAACVVIWRMKNGKKKAVS